MLCCFLKAYLNGTVWKRLPGSNYSSSTCTIKHKCDYIKNAMQSACDHEDGFYSLRAYNTEWSLTKIAQRSAGYKVDVAFAIEKVLLTES